MKTVNQYNLILKSGVPLQVTRNEEPNKTAIGLWKWSQRQIDAVIIDFNECSVDLSDVSIIYKAEVLSAFEHEPAQDMCPLTAEEFEAMQPVGNEYGAANRDEQYEEDPLRSLNGHYFRVD